MANGQLRVAIAQFTASIGDVRSNLAQMRCLMDDGAQDRADLICFPELCLPGYLLDPAGYDGAFLADLSRADEVLQADARRSESMSSMAQLGSRAGDSTTWW